MSRRNWTRDELLLTLNLYCKLPFSKYDQRTPEVQKLAKLIERTPSAVAMKLANFASLDTTHQDRGVRGLQNASVADKAIWKEFTGNWGDVALESEQILETLTPDAAEVTLPESEPIVLYTEKEQMVKVRIGQRFFRNTILGNYQNRCCICGLPISELLIASHIIPWSHREELRLNPQNGLCLCSLHDKAFDTGYITLNQKYEVVVSRALEAHLPMVALEDYFLKYQHRRIVLPDKFVPLIEFTEYHRVNIFHN